jgi:sugar porter (SP) family MFS transporter
MTLPHWNSFYGITVACSFGFALFGYDSSLMSGVLANKQFKSQFNYPDTTLEGQITSAFDLGCFVTAVITSIIGNKWSRRSTIMIGCSIHIIGGIIQCSSYTIGQLIAGRLIAGFGNGFITVAIPVWQSEVTPAHIRGRLNGLLSCINGLGGILIAWVNYGMIYVNSPVSWRFPVALQVLLSGLTLVMIPFLGESPRWLIIKSRYDEARTVLAGLYCEDEQSDIVHTIFLEIKEHVQHENDVASESRLKDLFRRKDPLKNLQRIMLGAGSQFMQQWGGINVILYYATVLFEESLGFDASLSYILSACNQINSTISLMICTFFLVDRVGRKPLMFWGALAQGICYMIVVIALSIGTRKSSIVAISFMFGYYTSYGLSWWMVPWLYPAEINSLQYRNTGAAVATATNWIFNYVIVLITPTGIGNISWRYYIIYAVMNFSFMPLIYYFYEETAGLTLEEIDELFEYTDRKKSFREILPFNHRNRTLRRSADQAPEKAEDEFVEDA